MKELLTVRVDRSDIAAWRESAKQADLTLSEWIRRKCNLAPINLLPVISPAIPLLNDGQFHAKEESNQNPKKKKRRARMFRDRSALKTRYGPQQCAHGFYVVNGQTACPHRCKTPA